MRIMIAALAALVCVGGAHAAQPSSSSTLPPLVSAAVTEADRSCGAKATHRDGFIAVQDVTGDGVPDYVIDYGKFACDGNDSFFCGSAGCLLQIFVGAADGKYRKVIDQNALGFTFGRKGERSTLALELHGSACGKAGFEACYPVLAWNGHKFAPIK